MSRPLFVAALALGLTLLVSTAVAEASTRLAPPDARPTSAYDPACAGIGYIIVTDLAFQYIDSPGGNGLIIIPILIESKLPCPGPPARLAFVSTLTETSCGSTVSLLFEARDAEGLAVVDGTVVAVSTTLGNVQTNVLTRGGIATASLNLPTKTTGEAVITIAAGEGSASKLLTVTC